MPIGKFQSDRDDRIFVSLEGETRLGSVSVDAPKRVIGDTPSDYESEGEDSGLAWNYIGLAVSRRRVTVFFGVVSLFLLLITARVAQMQVAEGEVYRNLAEGNRIRTEWIPSERGVIYDRQGIPLVRNVPQFDLTVTPADLPADLNSRQQLLLRLADISGVGPVEIEDRLAMVSERSGQPVVVAERLDHDQAIRTEIESSRTGAVHLAVSSQRYYEQTADIPSLSHILGYPGRVSQQELSLLPERSLSTDTIGKSGLEKTYQKQLRGSYGKREVETDALGRRKSLISEESGADGLSLSLSVDLAAQQAAEAFLLESLENTGASRGSVVVMEPDTGLVRALVSWPAFDANRFAQGIGQDEYQKLVQDSDRPLFPRAISASLPSGSIFKLSVAAAALEERLITKDTTILSIGGINVGIWRFPDWKYGGHGLTNVTKAIAESVNTFFYAIGGGWDKIKGLGVARIVDYASRFGLGSPTGIDLPGEASGFLPSKQWKKDVKGEGWYIGDTYHLAIGQGDLLVTPMQIAVMTAVFANGGKLVRPRLVQAMIGNDGHRLESQPEILEEQVVSQPSIDIVRQGMRDAVTYGSARSLSWLSVSAAGKTGTAQWGRDREPHGWFTGYAPYEDPELVITVMVEEGGGGSTAATPVARRFLDWWSKGQPPLAEYLEDEPYWPAVPKSEPEEGENATDPSGGLDADSASVLEETVNGPPSEQGLKPGIDVSKIYFLDRLPVAP